ncbi:MAG TPA: PQQ-dependent sugar dehydrogenase [Actinomycetota bacterium]|nr:PQQ-dependent sugar dehydrogenase [Actinomycetota bacterium]
MSGRTVAVIAAVGVGVAVISSGLLRSTQTGTVLVSRAAFPTAMEALPDGGLLFAERLTGRIRVVTANGSVQGEALSRVAVRTDGQRGLLGLARESGGDVFAAWVDPSGSLLVGRVAPGPTQVIWRGPTTRRQSNGGRIAITPDGRLIVGVGDLLDRELVTDPSAPNGKLLLLDPSGEESQRPEVHSSGWNNPFAFDVDEDGAVWVADNAPGSEPERLARVSPAGVVTVLADLPARTAPSGLALVSGGLLVCGFKSRELLGYPLRGGVLGEHLTLAEDCALGVVRLADGRVAYANEREIRVLGAGS